MRTRIHARLLSLVSTAFVTQTQAVCDHIALNSYPVGVTIPRSVDMRNELDPCDDLEVLRTGGVANDLANSICGVLSNFGEILPAGNPLSNKGRRSSLGWLWNSVEMSGDGVLQASTGTVAISRVDS